MVGFQHAQGFCLSTHSEGERLWECHNAPTQDDQGTTITTALLRNFIVKIRITRTWSVALPVPQMGLHDGGWRATLGTLMDSKCAGQSARAVRRRRGCSQREPFWPAGGSLKKRLAARKVQRLLISDIFSELDRLCFSRDFFGLASPIADLHRPPSITRPKSTLTPPWSAAAVTAMTWTRLRRAGPLPCFTRKSACVACTSSTMRSWARRLRTASWC